MNHGIRYFVILETGDVVIPHYLSWSSNEKDFGVGSVSNNN